MKSYVPFLLLALAVTQCEAGLLLQNLGHAAKTVGEGIKNGTMKAGEMIKGIFHLGKKKTDEATTVHTPPDQPGVPPVQNDGPFGPLSKPRTTIDAIPRCEPGKTFSDGACRTAIAELD